MGKPDPFDCAFAGMFASVLSIPSAYFFIKHGDKRYTYKVFRHQLLKKSTKIYRGPLNVPGERFAVQRIVKSKDVEESSYHGAAIGSGSSFYHPVMAFEDKSIVNKKIRSTFNIKRFEGLGVLSFHLKHDDDVINPNFHYWLNWDRVDFKDDKEFCYETFSIFSNNENNYTVAYTLKKDYIEYLGICDGDGTEMMDNIAKDELYSNIILGINGMIMAGIWGKTIAFMII